MFESAGIDEAPLLFQPLDDVLVSILHKKTKISDMIYNTQLLKATEKQFNCMFHLWPHPDI